MSKIQSFNPAKKYLWSLKYLLIRTLAMGDNNLNLLNSLHHNFLLLANIHTRPSLPKVEYNHIFEKWIGIAAQRAFIISSKISYACVCCVFPYIHYVCRYICVSNASTGQCQIIRPLIVRGFISTTNRWLKFNSSTLLKFILLIYLRLLDAVSSVIRGIEG